jgi:hypothetical protein
VVESDEPEWLHNSLLADLYGGAPRRTWEMITAFLMVTALVVGVVVVTLGQAAWFAVRSDVVAGTVRVVLVAPTDELSYAEVALDDGRLVRVRGLPDPPPVPRERLKLAVTGGDPPEVRYGRWPLEWPIWPVTAAAVVLLAWSVRSRRRLHRMRQWYDAWYAELDLDPDEHWSDLDDETDGGSDAWDRR